MDALSSLVIRLMRVDLERAIDLLEQEHAAKPVRQGHIGDGKLAVRALEHGGA